MMPFNSYSSNAIGKRFRRLGVVSRRGITIHENEVKRAIEVINYYIFYFNKNI